MWFRGWVKQLAGDAKLDQAATSKDRRAAAEQLHKAWVGILVFQRYVVLIRAGVCPGERPRNPTTRWRIDNRVQEGVDEPAWRDSVVPTFPSEPTDHAKFCNGSRLALLSSEFGSLLAAGGEAARDVVGAVVIKRDDVNRRPSRVTRDKCSLVVTVGLRRRVHPYQIVDPTPPECILGPRPNAFEVVGRARSSSPPVATASILMEGSEEHWLVQREQERSSLVEHCRPLRSGTAAFKNSVDWVAFGIMRTVACHRIGSLPAASQDASSSLCVLQSREQLFVVDLSEIESDDSREAAGRSRLHIRDYAFVLFILVGKTCTHGGTQVHFLGQIGTEQTRAGVTDLYFDARIETRPTRLPRAACEVASSSHA